MWDDNDFDACDEGHSDVSDEASDNLDRLEAPLPDFEVIDPEDDGEAEPAPGDFWFETDDSGDD